MQNRNHQGYTLHKRVEEPVEKKIQADPHPDFSQAELKRIRNACEIRAMSLERELDLMRTRPRNSDAYVREEKAKEAHKSYCNILKKLENV